MPTYRENGEFIHVSMPDYTIEPTVQGDGLNLTLVIDGKDYGRTVPDASDRSRRALHVFARQVAQHLTIDKFKPDASPEDRLACMNWTLAYELAAENGASSIEATAFASESALEICALRENDKKSQIATVLAGADQSLAVTVRPGDALSDAHIAMRFSELRIEPGARYDVAYHYWVRTKGRVLFGGVELTEDQTIASDRFGKVTIERRLDR